MSHPQIRKRLRPSYPLPFIGTGGLKCGSNRHLCFQRLSDLKMPRRQLKKHSQKQIDQIAASISRFGWTNPILVDANNLIVAGTGRYLAAKSLGIDHVPTLSLAHLSEEEVRAYAVADNKLAEKAGWDEELLALELGELINLDFAEIEITGFETCEIDALIDRSGMSPADADTEEEIEAPPDEPVAQLGDLFLLGDHKLLCGDALLPETYRLLLKNEPVRMVFSDPPYNVPVNGHICGSGKVRHKEFLMGSGEMSEAEFIRFLATVFNNLRDVSIDGAIHYQCMDWRHIAEMMAAGRTSYSELKNLIVWSKDNAGMGTFYRSQHELIFVWKVGKAPHLNNFGLGETGRYRTNIWSYPGANSMGRNRLEDLAAHPTVKPTSLVADAIKDVSKRGDIVLDPFCGSGTTVLAAERTGRSARCVELDPRYVDVAIRRWQKATGQFATHAESGRTLDELAEERLSGGEA